MESKNVIAAISLSAAVIILYSLFFQPDPKLIKQNLAEQKKIANNTDTPDLDKNQNFVKPTHPLTWQQAPICLHSQPLMS